jgi:hypothetical protein
MAEDEIDRLLRRTLGTHPRPQLPQGFTSGLRRRVGVRQGEVRRERGGARLLLATNWAAALLATALVLDGVPWPEWAPRALWTLALALAPLAIAAALWPRQAAAWLALACRPLLAEPSSGPVR